MIQLGRTFDLVHLSYIRSLLSDAGVAFVVLDTGAGGIWPGAIPARIMVEEDDEPRARRVLAEAGVTLDD